MDQPKRKIVIIGGGFGGLAVAKSLKRVDAEITLIDKLNHHLFQPLLYQVATASLSPGEIAVPLRNVLSDYPNIRVIMGEVVSIFKDEKEVLLKSGDRYAFDELVIATGARHSYFGHDDWEPYATGLKTLKDALMIRERILMSFERAEVIEDPVLRQRYLTFVIIGGGPTGVEMAGAISEIARHTLKDDFRRIDPARSRIVLIEGSARLLNRYPDVLCEKAKEALITLGVEIKTNSVVSDVQATGVRVGEDWIEANTIIWAAGNTAPPFLKTLDVPLDKSGRVIVNADLTIPGYPYIFVIGDSALAMDLNNNPLPGVAPVALQQGKYVGKLLRKQQWRTGRPLFRYFDKGTMATIGRARAVATVFSFNFSGLVAWLMWSFIHVMFLVTFRTKLLVMLSWGWNYLKSYRGVRLITKSDNDAPTGNV